MLGDTEDQGMKKIPPPNAKRALQDVIWHNRNFLVFQFILWSAKAHHFFPNKYILICVFNLRIVGILVFVSVVTLPFPQLLAYGLWLVTDVCWQFDQFVRESTHSHTCFIFFWPTGTIKISSGAYGIIVAVSVMFYAFLTSVLGIADLLCSSWSKSDWSFANTALWYLFIFFSNDWINVSLRHSVSEFLRSSCTFSCLLNYRSVPLLFSFQLQVQVLFLALRWTEGMMEENRPYNLRFWDDIEPVVLTCRSYQKIIGNLGW